MSAGHDLDFLLRILRDLLRRGIDQTTVVQYIRSGSAGTLEFGPIAKSDFGSIRIINPVGPVPLREPGRDVVRTVPSPVWAIERLVWKDQRAGMEVKQ
jgi:hypothetical protein